MCAATANAAVAASINTANVAVSDGTNFVCSISIVGPPKTAKALTALAIPITSPRKLIPVDTNRPADVIGNPLIASCTADTRRDVGRNMIKPAATTSGADSGVSGRCSIDPSPPSRIARNVISPALAAMRKNVGMPILLSH